MSWARSALSKQFPQLWVLALGALVIAVVILFPQSLAGIYRRYVDPWVDRMLPPPRRRAHAVTTVETAVTQVVAGE